MVSCRQFFADELKAIDKQERDYRGSGLSSHGRAAMHPTRLTRYE
jgi:hypothetical protein